MLNSDLCLISSVLDLLYFDVNSAQLTPRLNLLKVKTNAHTSLELFSSSFLPISSYTGTQCAIQGHGEVVNWFCGFLVCFLSSVMGYLTAVKTTSHLV